MEHKITLGGMIHLAVMELDNMEYEEYIEDKKHNRLATPNDILDKRIEKLIAKENRKESQRVMAKRLYKAAVCFALIFSCMSGAFLTAEAVRESVVTVAIEWYEKFTRTTITAENTPTELPEIELGYIPEGFVEDDSSFSSKGMYYCKLVNESSYIEVTAIISEQNNRFNVDNERLGYYIIEINDKQVFWAAKEDKNILLYSSDGINFSLRGHTELEELINIYKNIKIL